MPSFTVRLDDSVDVPGYGTVPYGLAIMEAINTTNPPHHPEIDGVDHCHHVEFIAPGSTAQHSRHAMVIYPGWFDRSPCAPAPAPGWRNCTPAASSA